MRCCQNGEATGEKDIDKMVKVLEMAATTGNPVVTFYASAGAKLAEGLGALAAGAKLCAAVAKVSGVVPQIAVVTGVCGASSALAAAGADVCIMSEEGEFFSPRPSPRPPRAMPARRRARPRLPQRRALPPLW